MRKLTLLVLAALFGAALPTPFSQLTPEAKAQRAELNWARRAGGAFLDNVLGVTSDAAGNVYSTGFYNSSVTFQGDPTNGSYLANGADDFFLTKYDPAGNVLWIRRGGTGGNNNERGMVVTTDATGAVYVAGTFMGRATFSGRVMQARGQQDVFVAKYSATGDLLWITQAGSILRDQPTAIAVSGTRVWVTGAFQAAASFGTTVVNNGGLLDAFLASYDVSTGALGSVRSIGGASDEQITSLAFDAAGNIYVGGFYGPTPMRLDNGAVSVNSRGGADAFVLKYKADGSREWVRSFGGPNQDYCYGLTLDNNGDVYHAGRVRGTVSFGDLTDWTLNGSDDAYISKLTADGETEWLDIQGGRGTDFFNSITFDAVTGSLYLAANYQNDVQMGATGINSVSNSVDAFVVKYNTIGNKYWTKSYGSTSLDYFGTIFARDGRLYAGGYFSGSVNFGGVATNNDVNQFPLISRGSQEAVTCKWTLDPGCPVTLSAGPDRVNCGTGVTLVGGISNASGYTFEWIPSTGIQNPSSLITSASPTVATTYTLIARSISNPLCFVSDEVYVALGSAAGLPRPTLRATSPAAVCPGGTVSLALENTAGMMIEWRRNGLVIPGSAATLVVEESGEYIGYVRNENCFVASNPILVTNLNAPNVNINNGAVEASVCAGSTTGVQLNAAVTGGVGALTYAWSPNTGLSSAVIANPIANPSTNVTYTVVVTDASGGCSGRDVIIVNTIAAGNPGPVTVSNVTSTTALVSWPGIATVDSYELFYKRLDETTYTRVTVRGNTHTLTNLTPQMGYEVAIGSACYTPLFPQDYNQFETLPALVCGIPENFRVTGTTINSISVAWNAVINAIGYQVEIALPGTDRWYAPITTSTSYTFNEISESVPLDPNTLYLVRVRTLCSADGVNNSDYANTSATTTNIPTCAAATTFAASNITSSSATLSWGNVAGALSYTLSVSPANLSFSVSASGTTVSQVVAGLSPATTYTANVVTNCASGTSNASTVQFTTPASTACAVPAGLAVSGLTANTAVVSWTGVTGVAQYTVRYNVFGQNVFTAFTTTQPNATLTGLTPATRYQVTVRSVCSGSNSAYASPREFVTDAGSASCVTPINLTFTNVTATAMDVNWETISGASRYQVQYRVNATGTTFTSITATTPSTQIVGLTANTEYIVRVRAFCAATNAFTGWSAAFRRRTAATREMEASNNAFSAEVYPNPTNGFFTTSLAGLSAGQATVRVFDVTGKNVFERVEEVSAGDHKFGYQLDVTPGLYFVRIQNGSHNAVSKLIVR